MAEAAPRYTAGSATQVVTGDVQVDLGGGATGTVGSEAATLDQVMEVANSIWAAIRRSGVSKNDDKGNDALMARLQVGYKEFSISYPIPFRWMVQAREYEPRAFEQYLREHVKSMYKDRKEFMAAQGEYLVILYKFRNPRVGSRQQARYRAAVAKSLQDDDDTFTSARAEAEEAVKELDEVVQGDRRRRLMEYLQATKDARDGASAAE